MGASTLEEGAAVEEARAGFSGKGEEVVVVEEVGAGVLEELFEECKLSLGSPTPCLSLLSLGCLTAEEVALPNGQL